MVERQVTTWTHCDCEIHSETLKLYNHLAAKQTPTNNRQQRSSILFGHYQVQEWSSATEVTPFQMDPITENVMYPVLTDIAAAPEGLLHVIRCNCKTDCRSSPMFLPSSWTRVHYRLWRMQKRGVYEYSQQNVVP